MQVHSAIYCTVTAVYATAEHNTHTYCSLQVGSATVHIQFTAQPFAHIDNNAKDVDKVLLSLEKL